MDYSSPRTLQHAHCRGRGLNPRSADQWITALPAEPRLFFCSLVLLGSNLVQRLYYWIMWCSLDPYSGISFSVALPQREFRYPPLFCASGAVMVQCWTRIHRFKCKTQCTQSACTVFSICMMIWFSKLMYQNFLQFKFQMQMYAGSNAESELSDIVFLAVQLPN